MKKRGLSSVITTLLLVLLAIVAVGIVWVLISNIINNQSNTINIQSQLFGQQVDFSKVSFDPSNPLQVTMSIKRGSGTLGTGNTPEGPEEDVIPVSDLAGSMSSCLGISSACCSTLGGFAPGGGSNCYSIPSSQINNCASQCGGEMVDGLTPTKNASKQFIDLVLGASKINKVGLVAYNDSTISIYSSDLTNDSSTLNSIVDSWQADGSTSICRGINNATSRFQGLSPNTLKTMIVMTNGATNIGCGGDAIHDAIVAACNAYTNVPNLTIYAVGLGNDVNMTTLSKIAQCGHGENFSASNLNDLINVYKDLASKITNSYIVMGQKMYLKLVFYDANNSVSKDVSIPGPQETNTYSFDLNGELAAPITKIEIYPVIVSSGKEVVGPVFDSWVKQ